MTESDSNYLTEEKEDNPISAISSRSKYVEPKSEENPIPMITYLWPIVPWVQKSEESSETENDLSEFF